MLFSGRFSSIIVSYRHPLWVFFLLGFMPPIWLDPSHLHYSILLRVFLWPSSILLHVSSWCVGVYESGEDGSSRVVVGQHPDPPTSRSSWLHLLDTTANPKRNLSRTLWKVCRAATTLRLGCLHHLLPAPCFLFSCLWTALSVTGFVVDLWCSYVLSAFCFGFLFVIVKCFFALVCVFFLCCSCELPYLVAWILYLFAFPVFTWEVLFQ